MEEQQIHDTLMTAFRRRDGSGSYSYSDADVAHFLPYLFFKSSIDFDDVSPTFQLRLVEVLRAAGASAAATPEELARSIDAYYQAHPINRQLAREFALQTRSILVSGAGVELSSAIRRMFSLGSTRAPDGKRVPGTMTVAMMTPRRPISGR